jgi:peptidyl-prolyl cis-trans isomerase D
MLDTIRRAQPAIIKGVLGAVVVAFVATIFLDWGWRRSGRPDTHLASVGNEVITLREYQLTYNNLVDFYRRLYQDRFTDDLVRGLSLKWRAVDTLVQRKLLLHEARRQGLTVSDAELVQRVQSYPAFQVNGAFDRQRYVQVLRFSRLTAADFERGQREELLLAKLEQLIKDGVQVTETEVKEAFHRGKEQVSAEYLLLDPAHFMSQVEVSEADVEAHHQAHQERFRKPEQVRVAYLSIDPKSLTAQVQVTEEQLAQYFEAHKEEYRREQQVRARHILFRLSPQAGPDEEFKVRAEAEAVLKRARAGEDFATLASEFSGDPASAQRGGDLGFFKRGAMVKAFEDVAFALKPGEVSDLVRTDFGFHLIKLEEVQEAGYTPFAEVREQLRERLTHEAAQRLAETQAKEVREALAAEPGAWEENAQRFALRLRETSFMARGQAVEDIENAAIFSQVAFALQVGEISQPTLIGSQYVIMKPLERKEVYDPPLAEVRDAVRESLMQERSTELARQRADQLLTEVRAGTSLEALALTLHTPVEETGFFSRGSAIPKLGRPQELITEAFRMGVGEARMFTLQGKPAVVALKERTTFDAEAYAKEKAEVSQRVLRQKRERLFSQWLSDLRQQAEQRGEIFLNQTLLTQL